MPTFSNSLEQALQRALSFANDRKHEYATLEHLLLALIDDDDATDTMRACNVDPNELKDIVKDYVDNDLNNLVSDDVVDSKPTTGFQRVIQRAVIHANSAGRDEVNGAGVLVAIFAERESHAAYFLQEQEMTRFDAVNYISHGFAKRPIEMRQPENGDLPEQPPNSEKKTFAQVVFDEIDELRVRRLTSSTTIASGVNISPRTLQRWRKGEIAEPSIQIAIQIFVFLGLTEAEALTKFNDLTIKYYSEDNDHDSLNQIDTRNLDLATRSDIGNQDQDMAVFHKLIRHSVNKNEKFIFISHSNHDNKIKSHSAILRSSNTVDLKFGGMGIFCPAKIGRTRLNVIWIWRQPLLCCGPKILFNLTLFARKHELRNPTIS